MKKFFTLLEYDLKIGHRIYHLIKNSVYLLLLLQIILALILPESLKNNQIQMIWFSFIILIVSLNIPDHIIKLELADGSLENLMVSYKSWMIILSKFVSIVMLILFGMGLMLPLFFLLYDYSLSECLILLSINILLVLFVVSLKIIANIIQAYFRQNTQLILLIIMPLIIPVMIISKLALQSLNFEFVLILIGINMIFIPIIFWFASYLLDYLFEF